MSGSCSLLMLRQKIQFENLIVGRVILITEKRKICTHVDPVNVFPIRPYTLEQKTDPRKRKDSLAVGYDMVKKSASVHLSFRQEIHHVCTICVDFCLALSEKESGFFPLFCRIYRCERRRKKERGDKCNFSAAGGTLEEKKYFFAFLYTRRKVSWTRSDVAKKGLAGEVAMIFFLYSEVPNTPRFSYWSRYCTE